MIHTAASQLSKKFYFFDKSSLIGKTSIEAAGGFLRFVNDQKFFSAEHLLKITDILKGQRPGVDQNVLLATLPTPTQHML